MVLIYRVRSFLAEWKSTEQRVSITWTNCHFGGRRPWFTCSAHTNGRYCGRRVAVLYLTGKSFACRTSRYQRGLAPSPNGNKGGSLDQE